MQPENQSDVLRVKLLACLKGSSSKNPVEVGQLRKLVPADPQAFDKLLDELHATHIVNHANGFRLGEPFNQYWLTGAVHPAQPFTFSPSSPTRPVQTSAQPSKVKPDTSTSTNQEKTIMAAPSSIRTTLLDLISKNPGIKRSDLLDQALTICPGEMRFRAMKTLGNLEYCAKLIEKTGKFDLCAYTLKSGTKGNKKTGPSAVAKKPSKKSKPRVTVDFVKKPHPVPAVPIVAELKYGFNLGGSFTLRKNGRDILLSPDEAMDLMQYGARQIAMINQTQGDSA